MGPVQRRLLKAVGESGFRTRTGTVHAWVYRRTRGRVGHAVGRITNLLLITTGQRSATPRTVPLAYVRDGDAFVVVASNGGSDRHPAWWLNLQVRPEAIVEVGGEVVPVRAIPIVVLERREQAAGS